MVDVRFSGGNEVRALAVSLAAESVRVGARVARVVRRTAAAVERDAKALCPVDTGFLRNSITTSVGGDGRSSLMSAEVGPSANYAPFVEFGTSRMAPQPFLMPALAAHENEFYLAVQTEGGTPEL